MAAGALVVGIFAGYSISSESIPPAAVTGGPQLLETPTDFTIPGDGTYRVGPDVSPGLYRSLSNGDRCSWTRMKDARHEPGSVLAKDSSLGSTYVRLVDGDFFDTDGCDTWRRVVAPSPTATG